MDSQHDGFFPKQQQVFEHKPLWSQKRRNSSNPGKYFGYLVGCKLPHPYNLAQVYFFLVVPVQDSSQLYNVQMASRLRAVSLVENPCDQATSVIK